LITDDPAETVDEYRRAAELPLLWQWTAREYVCSANILREAVERGCTFADPDGTNVMWKPRAAIWLLYGLALENALKGLLVARGADPARDGTLGKSFKTHDLANLWKRAALQCPAFTETLLTQLSWWVETGKYPIGTKPAQDSAEGFWNSLIDARTVLALIERVEDAIRSAKPSWALPKRDLLTLTDGAG
jgi:hypothetical protein